MKKLLLYGLIILSLYSCKKESKFNSEKQKSSKLELRQLIQETETKKQTYGSYFLIGGSFHQNEEKVTTVKVFALVDSRYRLIEMPIDEIRISIDNKISTPNITIEYESPHTYTDEELVSNDWEYKVYVINCPEQYLPEKLLPIEL